MTARRLDALLARLDRVVLGVTGPPGAGKSTLAAQLAATAPGSVVVPMDGFHLADAELTRLGLRERKGAINTFDAYGYLALLQRIRTGQHVVYAPAFDRALEQPVAGSIAVPYDARLVIAEGNYLLDDAEPWPAVAAQLTEVWYLDVDRAERRRRLEARHVEFGKSPAEASAWVDVVDESNARRIESTRAKADLIVSG